MRRPVTASNRRFGPYPYFGANGQQGWIDRYLFDEPLLLLAEDGGHFAQPDRGIAYRIAGKTWVNNHAHVLRPREGVDLGYLCRVLENLDVSRYVTGTTRAKLTKAGAAQIQFPLPSLAVQRRTAQVLDRADVLRDQRRAALAQLDTITQSIFLDMFGDPSTNPLRWPVLQLGSVTSKIGSGATPRGGNAAYVASGVALIRSLNVRDAKFSFKELAHIDVDQAGRLANVVVHDGDVLLNITGASVARVCRVPSTVLPARVNQHVCIVRPTGDLLPNYCEQFLANATTKRTLLGIAESGATRQALTRAQLVALPILLPPRALQERFAASVAKTEACRQSLQAASRHLDTLFASLQHSAFRGEL